MEENRQAALGKTVCTDMAIAFCNKIRAAGYQPMLYTNLNWATNYIDMARIDKARPAIYGMAGFYLAYLSYSMFKEISNTSGTEQMIMVIFSILFAVIGVGGILFGLLAGYKNSKKK